MRTGQTARKRDKLHTNARVTFIHRTYLSDGVRSKFRTCPKLANGQDQTKQISPDMECIPCMGNGQQTHANDTTDRVFYCPLRIR